MKTFFLLLVAFFIMTQSVVFAADAAHLNAVRLTGELTQGSMITALAAPGAKASLNGKTLNVSADGQFVFGFGRDAELKHELLVINPDGTKQTRQITLEKRQYNIQRIEGISKKIMNPKKADVERSKQDNRDIGKARKNNSKHLYFLQSFIWPATGPITGVYGSQRFYNGQARRPHYGLDIAGPKGADVVAPADGVITLTKDMFYSGNTILLDHGYGVSSTFIHLDSITVELGQSVKQGDKIGTIGATGRVTGPHLDWRINWFSTRLDPHLLVKDKKQ